MKFPTRFATALALLLTSIAMPTLAQNAATVASGSQTQDGTLVSVSAQASAQRVPDMATLSTGVVTQANDANTAMRMNAEQMARVNAAIKSAGIAARDVRTSGVNLNARYDYENGKTPRITGYEARNTVNIKVRDISKLGKLMDALVAAGANDLNGPSFEVDKADEAYDEARLAALEKARKRADLYANALGLRVRRIVSIDEGGGMMNPMPVMRAMSAGKDASTEIAPGESSLGVTLNIVYELGK